MTFFRVQRDDRDVAELLDPDYQFSHAWSDESHLTRAGVSSCESIDELAEYLVCGQAGALDAAVRGGRWVIIEMEGAPSGASPIDDYEILIRPTAIVSITKIDDSDFVELMDAKVAFFDSFTTHDFDDVEIDD